MIAQTAVSLLNLGARRLAPPSEDPARPSERDLEQVRDAIDAVRALLEILERRIPQELRPLREALSQLQMAYARELAATTQTSTTQPTGPIEEPTDAGPAQPSPMRQWRGEHRGRTQRRTPAISPRRRAGGVERQAVGARTLMVDPHWAGDRLTQGADGRTPAGRAFRRPAR